METDGRVVAITGAGTGIGQVAAERFAAKGWKVVIGGRRVEKLQETREMIEQAGGVCFASQLDVVDGTSVEQFFDAAEAELGTVTAVIHNAAGARYGTLDTFSADEIAFEVNVKLTGALLMAARGIRSMKAAGVGGDIVFVTSASGVVPWVQHLAYAASNAGVEHAQRILRMELEGTGIRCGVLRVGETGGTEFGAGSIAQGQMPMELWFRRGLLRHFGLLEKENVADAMINMVSLPPNHMYDVVAINPVAPTGEIPASLEEFYAAAMEGAGAESAEAFEQFRT